MLSSFHEEFDTKFKFLNFFQVLRIFELSLVLKKPLLYFNSYNFSFSFKYVCS